MGYGRTIYVPMDFVGTQIYTDGHEYDYLDDALVIAVDWGRKYIREFRERNMFDTEVVHTWTIDEVKRKLNIADVDIQRFDDYDSLNQFIKDNPEYTGCNKAYSAYGKPFAYKIIYVGDSDTDIVSL